MNTPIDLSYFQEKIGLLNRDIDHYARSSADLARTLVRLAITANEGAVFREVASSSQLGVLLEFAEEFLQTNGCDCEGDCRCGYVKVKRAVGALKGE